MMKIEFSEFAEVRRLEGSSFFNPASRVMCVAPEQDLQLYVVFRMSSLDGETKQVLII